MNRQESNLLFFMMLANEFILGAIILDFYFGKGIIHSLMLFMFSLMVVLIFYAIRKKTSSPPKSKIIKFLQIGVLILFGTFNILLFLLQQYIISNI